MVQFPIESLLLSSESWYAQGFVCALQDWSLPFPQSCGSLVIKFHCPSRSDSLGIPSPFVGSPGWEVSCGVLNLHNSGRSSLVLFFSLWVTHPTDMGFDFFMIVPSYHLTAGSFLSLDMGYLFLVRSSVLLLRVVQQLAVILVLSQEEMSR